MEAAQYWIALATIVTVPPVGLAWFLIHPFARFWRKVGLAITYTVMLALVLVQVGGLLLVRRWLLSVHYGLSWPPVVAAIVLVAASMAIGVPRFRQLSPAVTIGVPEVSPRDPGKLLTEGIYAYIRHPRYVEIWLGLMGLALFANYLAMYVLVALYWPVMYAVVLLEERELRDRFGEAYEEYCRGTPRFIPRLTR
jgi:protein-S-isoprenylcysteine O-methyltransferase Ste14